MQAGTFIFELPDGRHIGLGSRALPSPPPTEAK